MRLSACAYGGSSTLGAAGKESAQLERVRLACSQTGSGVSRASTGGLPCVRASRAGRVASELVTSCAGHCGPREVDRAGGGTRAGGETSRGWDTGGRGHGDSRCRRCTDCVGPMESDLDVVLGTGCKAGNGVRVCPVITPSDICPNSIRLGSREFGAILVLRLCGTKCGCCPGELYRSSCSRRHRRGQSLWCVRRG